MKFITNDYGCGTSSSILDYNDGQYGVVVSPDNWQHVLDIKEDIFMVGHDFLLYMWDTDEKVNLWKAFPYKIYVWCFERIDAIIPEWKQKSYFSITQIRKFAHKIFACDEHDCDKFGYDWIPQWASPKFYEKRNNLINNEDKILFSGQAGKPEYYLRNKLLFDMQNDEYFKKRLIINNNTRELTEEEYLNKMLSFKYILNPIGVLEAFNVRTFEVLYANRILLQQVSREYNRHFNLIKNYKNCILFTTIEELKQKIKENTISIVDDNKFFIENNIQKRIKMIEDCK